MRLTPGAQRAILSLFLVAIAVVYGIAWFMPALGLQDSDATALVTANAIAQGHGYVVDNLPVPSPQTGMAPVFPAVLALFLNVSGATLWLKLLPLVCTAIWLYLAWRVLQRLGAEPRGALLMVAISAASPVTIFAATHLVPESLFALLISAALLAWLDDRMLPAGTLAGLAAATCPAGFALMAACALILTVRARFRRAIEFTVPAVLIATPWYAWAIARGAALPFTGFAPNEMAFAAGVNSISLFAGPLQLLSGMHDLYAALFTLGLVAWSLWRRRRMAPDLFLLFYGLILIFSPHPPLALLGPVLPLVLWLFWRGFLSVRIQEAFAAAVLIVTGTVCWASAARIPATLQAGNYSASPTEPSNDWKSMTALFDAIRKLTPADARLIAVPEPLFYYQTGRTTLRGYKPNPFASYYQPGGQAVTPDQLMKTIRGDSISFVILTPNLDFPDSASFHKAVQALERGGVLEPVAVEGLAPGYRLLRNISTIAMESRQDGGVR
jgi:hypothetical protein